MELLGGYGSDSGSELEPPQSLVAPISSAPPVQTLARAPRTSAPEPLINGISTLSDLPEPTSERTPLFSGLPMPATRRKRITAKFSCPIDYGDVPASHANDNDQEHAVKRMKRGGVGGNKGMSIADFLPAPKNTKAPPSSIVENKNEKVLGGGMSYEDDDIVPGAEDVTGMYLGKGEGEPADEGGDLVELPTVGLPGGAAAGQSHVRGVYDGQIYIYDTITQKYYYPDPNVSAAPQEYNHTQPIDTASGNLPGGIQFKEISGAQLRHMGPGQRAELNAMRSALGDDYENKLKSEAAKVGAVSKSAKRKNQLSSLYVQAKEQELEDMEKRTSGAKTKAETQRKYGW